MVAATDMKFPMDVVREVVACGRQITSSRRGVARLRGGFGIMGFVPISGMVKATHLKFGMWKEYVRY